jgi:hypothetical protein
MKSAILKVGSNGGNFMKSKEKMRSKNIDSLLALIGLIGATLILSLIHPNSVCAATRVDISCFSDCMKTDPNLWCLGVCGGSGSGDYATVGGKGPGGDWFQCDNGTQVQTNDGDLAQEVCKNLGSNAAAYCEKNYLGQCGGWTPWEECGNLLEYCGGVPYAEPVTRCDLVIETSRATNIIKMKAKTVGKCESELQQAWNDLCVKGGDDVKSCIWTLKGAKGAGSEQISRE